MTSQTHMDRAGAERDKMPAWLRYSVVGSLALIFAGALYLISVRGEALLVDVSAMSGRIFCF